MRWILGGTLIPVVLVLILGFVTPQNLPQKSVVYNFKLQKVVPATEFARFNPWFTAPPARGMTKEEIIKEKIKNDLGVVVDDEGKLSPRRLQIIYSILKSIPARVLNLQVLTLQNLELGYTTQDEIPDERTEVVDAFSSSVVHEINRHIATHGRESELIKHAGGEKMQYVRSMLEKNYFIENQQEFFPSLARAYFQDTTAVLDLAVERFGAGYHEPINQVLFFMDVYLRGGVLVPVFKMDEYGQLSSRPANLVRDEEGRITGLIINLKQYKFILDKDGFVTNISSY